MRIENDYTIWLASSYISTSASLHDLLLTEKLLPPVRNPVHLKSLVRLAVVRNVRAV